MWPEKYARRLLGMAGIPSPTSRCVTWQAPARSQAITSLSGGMGFDDGPYRGRPMAEKTSGNRRNSLSGSKVAAGDL